MEPVNLLLVGCGMMGARHVRGLGELERVAPGTVRLAAVCDLNAAAAEAVAAEAEQLLGTRPKVFQGIKQALCAEPSIGAADVVTDPRSHDDIVVSLLEAGIDVICEKPLAPTVARGRRMVEAAEHTGRVLATAENNRRSPVNRLAKAVLDAGLIGAPNFLLEVLINAGSRIVATAWRHRLAMGGILLDVGVHSGYILEALLGPIERVAANAQLVQAHREGKEFDGTDAAVDVDSEDAFAATLEFASGVQGAWTMHFSSFGETMFKRLILGSEGSMDLPGDRSGNPVHVRRGGDDLSGDDLLAELPGYQLNDIETRLFGERPASFDLEGAATDRKLIAAEVHDFVEAIRMGRPPEADGARGLRSVAIVYAILESALAGRPVAIAEVLDGRLHAYQDKVEAARLE